MYTNALTVGKGTRYPQPGAQCDTCHSTMTGQVLSLVAVMEKLIPQADGEVGYDGPHFTPLQYYCTPGCARAAPGWLGALNISMSEPGKSLVTRCASCGTLVDRTSYATDFVLDSVRVGGDDDSCETLHDLATLCPTCSPWPVEEE